MLSDDSERKRNSLHPLISIGSHDAIRTMHPLQSETKEFAASGVGICLGDLSSSESDTRDRLEGEKEGQKRREDRAFRMYDLMR